MTAVSDRDVKVHHYRPRGTCAELFHRRDEEVLLSGPAGTGKSRACLEKMNAMALKNPGFQGLLVRQTHKSLAESALKTWRKFVIPALEAAGQVRYYGGSGEKPSQYTYRNGSAIMTAGLDDPTKVMSTEYDAIYVQEAIEVSVGAWEALITRLRGDAMSFQQLIADTNPDAPTHWLKQRCDRGDTVMLNTRHEDNPILFNDDGTMTVRGAAYLKLLDKLTGNRKQRLRYGKWVAAEGVIFEGFDPAVHVIDSFPIPDDWRRWWVVDFGYVNPMVLQMWAENPDGQLFLYRELYHTGRLVEEMAADALRLVAPGGVWIEPKPFTVLCDHDAEGRATLEKYLDMGTEAADKNVLEGIEDVQRRLKREGPGTPRMFFFNDALVERDLGLQDRGLPTCTTEEMLSYTWAPPPKAQPDKQPKDEPLKEGDHGCDCVRYLARRTAVDRVTTRML